MNNINFDKNKDKKISVSPIIYNNGNRNIALKNIENSKKVARERRQCMTEEFKLINEMILKDNDLLNKLSILMMHNLSQEEGKQNIIDYSDYHLYDFVIKAYNKDELTLAFLNKKGNENLKSTIERYYSILDNKESIIKYYNLDKLLMQNLFMNYGTHIETLKSIARMLYLANKYKGTSFEGKVKDFLLSFINVEEIRKGVNINKKRFTKEEKDIVINYLSKQNHYLSLRNAIHCFLEGGNLNYNDLNTLLDDLSKTTDFFCKSFIEVYDALKQLENTDDRLKIFIENRTKEEYVVYKINKFLDDNKEDARRIDEVKSNFDKKLKELAEEEGLDITLTDAEEEQIKAKAIDFMSNLASLKLSDFEYTITNIFSMLSFDANLKAYLVENTIVEYAYKDEIQEKYIDDYKRVERAIKPKKISLEDRLKHKLTDEIIKSSNEWLKINNSKPNTSITDARDELATYQENDLERQERELQELQRKYDINPSEELQEEIEIKLEIIEENRKKLEELNKNIKALEDELSNLSKQYAEITEEAQKKQYEKQIKKIGAELQELKDKRDKRGLYVQKNIFNDNIEVQNEGVILSVKNSEFDISNYSSEGKRLSTYMQNQLYYNENNPYIIIDMEEYLEQSGRNKSTDRVVRKKIENELQAMYNESYTLKIKDPKTERELTGQIRLVQEFWQEKYNGKKTFAIKLTDRYKQILLSDKTKQWASIPLLLNQLKQTPTEERAREVGFYLYKTLRSDLKNQKVGHDYSKKFKMKTFADLLEKKGLNINDDIYSKRIIKPLEDALEKLVDLNLIEYNTDAFINYFGANDDNLGEEEIKGMKGQLNSKIKTTFENEDIVITYKIADYEEYNKIISKRAKKVNVKKKDK